MTDELREQLRNTMEIKWVAPHSQIIGNQGKAIFVAHLDGDNPHIYMWGDLIFTNHGMTRREVITSAHLTLKKRHYLFWDKTLVTAPLSIERSDAAQTELRWTQLTLEPLSPPITICVKGRADIEYPKVRLSKHMSLVLEFKTVGPHKRMKRTVKKIPYPTSVS